jgi:hypothetical protein
MVEEHEWADHATRSGREHAPDFESPEIAPPLLNHHLDHCILRVPSPQNAIAGPFPQARIDRTRRRFSPLPLSPVFWTFELPSPEYPRCTLDRTPTTGRMNAPAPIS